MEAIGLTERFDHPLVGRFDHVGLSYEFSQTPASIPCGPLVLGDSSEAILDELGFARAEIDALAADKAVGLWSPGEPMIEGRRILGLPKSARAEQNAD